VTCSPNTLRDSGPTELFGSAETYHQTVQDMIATKTVLYVDYH
jgi:hypothetical protein